MSGQESGLVPGWLPRARPTQQMSQSFTPSSLLGMNFVCAVRLTPHPFRSSCSLDVPLCSRGKAVCPSHLLPTHVSSTKSPLIHSSSLCNKTLPHPHIDSAQQGLSDSMSHSQQSFSAPCYWNGSRANSAFGQFM